MFASITVIGNLGGDPEIRHLPSGTTSANFSVATNSKWTDRETGEIKTRVIWFRVVAYQTGEQGLVTGLIQKWLKKGQMVFVQGEPILRKYTDREGVERTAFEIKLGPQSTLKMMGGGERPNGRTPDGEHGEPPAMEQGDPGPAMDAIPAPPF